MNLLALIKQLPKGYKVCLLKNEFGDLKGTLNEYVLLTEVDSELAKESNIDGVQEMLNGCLCCTLVISFMT
jgi:G3E family GTPase